MRNLPTENNQFINFQLLLDMILRLNQTEYAKQELLQFCRIKYDNNKAQMTQIKSFEEEYKSEDAAKWYTKDSFLHRLLIDTTIRSTPYAKITSVMGDEQEILFSMGPIFRIGVVEKLPGHDGIFIVKLTMVHIEDELWHKLTDHLNK